jgi:HPt (histidine-containing phosphotransfer) domain-containing protein
MTAHVMQGDRERCLEAGMDDYLAKPVSPGVLTQKLRHWLSKAREGFEAEARVADVALEGSLALASDWDRADLMRRLMNDTSLAKRVIAGFLDDLPKQIDRLEEAFLRRDWTVFKRQAHTIKGASANLGARRLQLRAEDLEAAAPNGNAAELERGVIDVRRHFQALRRVMAVDGEDS